MVPGGYSAKIPRNLVVNGSSCSNLSETSAIFPDNGIVRADAGGGHLIWHKLRAGEVIPWNSDVATRGGLAMLILGTNEDE